MNRNKGRKKRGEIAKDKQPSKARKIIMRATIFATTTCIGVGAEELIEWAWEIVRRLF